MDEGTAHLDAAHEQAVNAAISALGITRIIIAHRSETIAMAQRVLVLAEGQLHEPDLPAADSPATNPPDPAQH